MILTKILRCLGYVPISCWEKENQMSFESWKECRELRAELNGKSWSLEHLKQENESLRAQIEELEGVAKVKQEVQEIRKQVYVPFARIPALPPDPQCPLCEEARNGGPATGHICPCPNLDRPIPGKVVDAEPKDEE